MNTEIIDKIKGCLYGQAIEDALGFGSEAMSKEDVRKYYEGKLSHYEQIYQDERRSGWPIGMWTDDTEMLLSILDCIVNNPKLTISPKDLASYFLTFYDLWGHTCGILTRKALNFAPPMYRENPIAVAKLVWELKGKNNAPNGGLMRTSILGLWPFNVEDNAINVCQMTHYDSRCVCSCVIVSLLIYNIVWKNHLLQVDDLLLIADKLDTECREWILSAYNNSDISELNLDDEETSAYTYRSLSCAIWAYFHAQSFEEGLIKIVNEGGDADTNAAIACSVLGAKFGLKSIPEYYVIHLYHQADLESRFDLFIKTIREQMNFQYFDLEIN